METKPGLAAGNSDSSLEKVRKKRTNKADVTLTSSKVPIATLPFGALFHGSTYAELHKDGLLKFPGSRAAKRLTKAVDFRLTTITKMLKALKFMSKLNGDIIRDVIRLVYPIMKGSRCTFEAISRIGPI